MNNVDLVDKNRILEIRAGSLLYGTSMPTSDTDYSGIFVAPKEYYLGLERVEMVDLSKVVKLESGKNAAEAIDRNFHEMRKFMKLAVENNPTVLEMLFVNKENIIFKNELGQRLLDARTLFPWTGLKQKFVGYGLSQLHKAHIKVDNYDELNYAKEWLFEKQFEEAGRLLAEFRNENIKGIKFYPQHATIGDMDITLKDKLGNVYNKVMERLSKVGNREELYTKYGADVKFLSHACRLLLEGKELLTTGDLVFPLKDRKFLLEIRNGEHKPTDIIAFAQSLVKELDEGKFDVVVPSAPRYKELQSLMISLIEESWAKDSK